MRPRSVQFVVVLRGGQSAEHDVSLRSSQFVEAGLMAAGYEVAAIDIDRAGRWRAGGSDRSTANVSQAALASLDKADVVFPVLHGPMGEDGTVQGFLEVLGKPYVGCTVPGSAIAMDKGVSKALARAAGIPVLPAFVAVAADAETAAARAQAVSLTLPIFVKPCNMGSSVGVSRVDSWDVLAAAILEATKHDPRVLIEQGLDAPREIEISVLGNDVPDASVPGEIVPGESFYTFEAKYGDSDSQLMIPAELPMDQSESLRALAVRAFSCLLCRGLARVDFLLTKDGEAFLNEVNTLPGFTEISMYPKLWAASGLDAAELFRKLIELAVQHHHSTRTVRDTSSCAQKLDP